MKFVALLSVSIMAIMFMSSEAHAQPMPTLTVNGFESDITLLTGQNVDVQTSEGAVIQLFYDGGCVTMAGSDPVDSYFYQQPSPTIQSFQAHLVSDPTEVSPCRTVEWVAPSATDPPFLTIDNVAGDMTDLVDHTFSIRTHADATVDIFHNATCEGAPAASVVMSTNSHSVTPHSQSYRARWTSGEGPTSPCRVATWVTPPRTDPPPLTLNDGTENLRIVGMERFSFVSDPNAELDIYQALDCSGTVLTTSVHQFASTARPYNHYSVQAFWPENPELRSACLTVEIVHPVPPLTLNGSPGDATLSVGDTAVFYADPIAEISLFESADCTGAAFFTATESVSQTPTTETVISARSNWTGATEPVSDCLVATWVETTTATIVPDATTAPDPTAPPTTEPTATDSVVPTSTEPIATVTSYPTVSATHTPELVNQSGQSNVVTSLPSTGSGSSHDAIIAIVAIFMSITIVAGALRHRHQ